LEDKEMKGAASSFPNVRAFVRRAGSLLAVSVLAVLATTGPVMAKCLENGICEKGENARNCPIDCADSGGGKGGGEGNQVTLAEITFRDASDPLDRIQGDGAIYVTEEFPDGTVLVAIGSKANTGNVFLRGAGKSITEPFPEDSRELFLDFGDCALGPCTLPFDPEEAGWVRAGLRVDVNDVLKDGVYALAPGEMTSAPMTLQFQPPGPDVAYADYWFLNFDPAVKNCESATKVTVENLGSGSWRVEAGADALACLVRGGQPQAESLGLFRMPFKFTVEIP